MTALLLDVRGLTRAFGGLIAANNVDLTVGAREVVGLIGPNGAGKTTVFNMIAGSMTPTAGTVRFMGEDCTGDPAHRMAQRGVARTFQITSLFPTLTVAENVAVGTHRRKRSGWGGSILRLPRFRREEAEVRAKVAEVLEFLGMARQSEMIAQTLPYGDQRKLEIAIALAAEPALLLLDEPAAGMNPDEAKRLTAMIGRIRDTGVSVLLVEHHMRVVMGICDRIVVLNQGIKIAEGPPAAVANDPTVIGVYLGREAARA
ncbi:MAG: ABC transporter ATP-binding protein [Alphaproteobacteria bacterium]|nr:ABC transporter ATP-binding protein [Alphaproteobacteria bacterium]